MPSSWLFPFATSVAFNFSNFPSLSGLARNTKCVRSDLSVDRRIFLGMADACVRGTNLKVLFPLMDSISFIMAAFHIGCASASSRLCGSGILHASSTPMMYLSFAGIQFTDFTFGFRFCIATCAL